METKLRPIAATSCLLMSRCGRRLIALASGESGEWKAFATPGFAEPLIGTGDSGREFLVNDGGPRQHLLDHTIGELRHEITDHAGGA